MENTLASSIWHRLAWSFLPCSASPSYSSPLRTSAPQHRWFNIICVLLQGPRMQEEAIRSIGACTMVCALSCLNAEGQATKQHVPYFWSLWQDSVGVWTADLPGLGADAITIVPPSLVTLYTSFPYTASFTFQNKRNTIYRSAVSLGSEMTDQTCENLRKTMWLHPHRYA